MLQIILYFKAKKYNHFPALVKIFINHKNKTMKKFITALLLCAAISISGNLKSQVVSTPVTGPSTFDDALSIDSSGNLFASRYSGSTITKITPGGQTSIFANGIITPNGSDFGPDGYLYVPSNVSNGRIVKISMAGVVEPFIPSIPFPTTVRFRADRKMYICSCQQNRVYLADSTGTSTLLYFGNGMNCPVGLREDGNGNLIIANFTDGKIFKVDNAGVFTLITQIPGIIGFIEYANGYIYSTGFNTNKIYKTSMSGQTTVLAGTGATGQTNGNASVATFNGPNGIVASLGGDSLFISDYNARSLRVISNVTVGIANVSSYTPTDFILSQNYPNPFNPVTKISFELRVKSDVTVKVYDILGNDLKTLVNENKSAGRYEVEFNGEGLSSGIYYYKLTAGDFSETKSMVLLK